MTCLPPFAPMTWGWVHFLSLVLSSVSGSKDYVEVSSSTFCLFVVLMSKTVSIRRFLCSELDVTCVGWPSISRDELVVFLVSSLINLSRRFWALRTFRDILAVLNGFLTYG